LQAVRQEHQRGGDTQQKKEEVGIRSKQSLHEHLSVKSTRVRITQRVQDFGGAYRSRAYLGSNALTLWKPVPRMARIAKCLYHKGMCGMPARYGLSRSSYVLVKSDRCLGIACARSHGCLRSSVSVDRRHRQGRL